MSAQARATKREPLKVSEVELRATMRSVRSLVAVLGQSARRVEQRTGVTNAQLFVLQQLERHESLSINDIAALALTDQSAASIIVSRLERDGFVRRGRSPDDARRVLVSLTPAGLRLVRSAPLPPTGRLIAALRTLTPAQFRAFEYGLSRLTRVLGEDDGEPMMLFEPGPSRRRVRKSK